MYNGERQHFLLTRHMLQKVEVGSMLWLRRKSAFDRRGVMFLIFFFPCIIFMEGIDIDICRSASL